MIVPVKAPAGEPCSCCAALATVLGYDEVEDVCRWVCDDLHGLELCVFDPGTVPELDGVESS